MSEGMKVIKLGYKTTSSYNAKKATSKSTKEYTMVCAGRFGDKMVWSSPEPFEARKPGDILVFTATNDQTTIDAFNKADEEAAAEKARLKAEKKAGVKHKRE